MKLCVVNGSPRGKNSNTNKLFEYFTAEMDRVKIQYFDLRAFYNQNNIKGLVEEMKAFDSIIIGFPLYTDWLPGFVKELFEMIAQQCTAFKKKAFSYLIQSGFPEANHSRYVEKYCQRFTERIGAVYKGAIVRGGSEGARLMPEKYFGDSKNLRELGRIFERDGRFDENLLRLLAKPERLSPWKQFLYNLIASTPLAHIYWNSQLKRNGVFKQRDDQPYAE